VTEVKRSHIAAGAALSVLVGLAAATAGYAALRLQRSTRLARRAHPFERQAEPEGARLLVVGDSTAGGAGASDPIHSLPGLLSRANPSLSVVNKAEPGARFADILEQLDGNERFDAVLVLGGTRDVLGTTRDAAFATGSSGWRSGPGCAPRWWSSCRPATSATCASSCRPGAGG